MRLLCHARIRLTLLGRLVHFADVLVPLAEWIDTMITITEAAEAKIAELVMKKDYAGAAAQEAEMEARRASRSAPRESAPPSSSTVAPRPGPWTARTPWCSTHG